MQQTTVKGLFHLLDAVKGQTTGWPSVVLIFAAYSERALQLEGGAYPSILFRQSSPHYPKSITILVKLYFFAFQFHVRRDFWCCSSSRHGRFGAGLNHHVHTLPPGERKEDCRFHRVSING